MNRNLQKRRAAVRMSMEDYAEATGVEIPAVVPTEPTTDIPTPVLETPVIDQTVVSDLVEDAETSYQVDAFQSLENIGTSLQTIHGKMAESLPEGGMSPREADAWRTSVDIALKDVPDLAEQPTLPSQESFGGSMSRKEATTMSMEGVMDKVKEVGSRAWKVMVDFIKKLIARMSGIGAKLTESIKRIDSGYAALKDYAGKKVEVTIPALAIDYLSVNGNFNPAQAFRWWDSQFTPYMTTAYKQITDNISKLKSEMDKAANGQFDAEAITALKQIQATPTDGIDAVSIEDGKLVGSDSRGEDANITVDIRQILAMKDKSLMGFRKAASFNWAISTGALKSLVDAKILDHKVDKVLDGDTSTETEIAAKAIRSTAMDLLTQQGGLLRTANNFVGAWKMMVSNTVAAVKEANKPAEGETAEA